MGPYNAPGFSRSRHAVDCNGSKILSKHTAAVAIDGFL
jgi:hypothetical protein